MRKEVEVHVEVSSPPEAVFARVSDHEATGSWVPKVKAVTLLEPGVPDNGVPAVRRVEFKPFGWSTIDERIVAYDEDAMTFSYTIIAGMPGIRDHLGTLTVAPSGGGARVTWHIRFDFNPWLWLPFAGIFTKTFGAAVQEGLDTLARTSHKN